MKQTFKVEIDDGTAYEVATDARDIRAWEAEYEQSWFASPLSYIQMAQLAYLAGQRQNLWPGLWPAYKDFDAHCVEVRGLPAPVVANPTHEGATDTPS